MDDACELSLILPAFNEEAGIVQAIVEADDALRQLGIRYEIIVVDDGSRDQTATLVAQAARDRPTVRLVQHGINRGYGAALRSGFQAARGSRIAFTDADCQFDLADLALLLPLTEKHPIAVGYRVDRQDTWVRKFYSRGYNLLARTLLGTTVRDIDCALKVFRRDALARILPETNRFFVNTEMLSRAQQLGLTVAEVGVRHRPRQNGESKISIADVPRTLNAMLPFWWMRVMFAGPSEPDPQAKVDHNPSLALRAKLALLFTLFAMACVLFLSRLDHALLEPEEARYAEIPRQMLTGGRLVTPVLNGEDYWQKPPLLYWLVMVSYQIFGVHDWAARLVPALAGILCVIVTTGWAWRSLGFWPALVSGTILTLSMRFLYLAGMLSMDGLLCMFVLGGLAGGHLALTDGRRALWLALAAFCCALGILTKGPVAIVLIVVPLAAFAILDRRCRWLTKFEACVCAGIVALIAGPWFVIMAASAPEAAGSFVWLHHIVRYFAPLDHEKPAWFYGPSLLLGMLPWTLLLIPMIPYLLRRSRRAGQRRPASLGMFVLAFVWCVVFFSLSGCKRPGYILPALPLLALMIGTFVTHGLPWRRWMEAAQAPALAHVWARRLATATFGMATVLSVAAGLSGMWSATTASVMTLLFAAGAIAAWWTPMARPAWTSWAGCVAVAFFVLAFGQRVWLPEYHQRFGLREQMAVIAEYEQEETLPIVTYPKRWDSVGFYRQRANFDSYTPAEFTQLMHDLHKHGKAIVIVRREEALPNLIQALPDHLDLELLGRPDSFVVVALVRPR